MAERVYIDAELAKDAICECYITDDEKLMLIRRINRIPASDVVEVRHGQWVNEKYVWQGLKSAQCNQCKRKTDYYIQPNYCPTCGAKMNGGQDNEQRC